MWSPDKIFVTVIPSSEKEATQERTEPTDELYFFCLGRCPSKMMFSNASRFVVVVVVVDVHVHSCFRSEHTQKKRKIGS